MSEHRRDDGFIETVPEQLQYERDVIEPDVEPEIAPSDAGDPEQPDHPLGVDPDEPGDRLPGFPSEDPSQG
jgi:hypothetical protein